MFRVPPKCTWHVERRVNVPILCRTVSPELQWILNAKHSSPMPHINWPAPDKHKPAKRQKIIHDFDEPEFRFHFFVLLSTTSVSMSSQQPIEMRALFMALLRRKNFSCFDVSSSVGSMSQDKIFVKLNAINYTFCSVWKRMTKNMHSAAATTTVTTTISS